MVNKKVFDIIATLRKSIDKDDYDDVESQLSDKSNDFLIKTKHFVLHTNSDRDKRIINHIDGMLLARAEDFRNEERQLYQSYANEQLRANKQIKIATWVIAAATAMDLLALYF